MIQRYRSPIQPLLYWCTEREKIRKRRAEGLPAPWTDDHIFQTYRFCNLRRRDDRVSQWLINNVLSRREEFSGWSFIQFVALCRQINWPPTLAALRDAGLWPAQELDFAGISDRLESLPGKLWTGAYMIRAPSRRIHGDISKGRFVSQIVVAESLGSVKSELMQALDTKRLALVWEVMQGAVNWGSFTAGQVVADLTYTPVLGDANDLYTWAPQGPGSCAGFNRLMGRPVSTRIPMEEWLLRLQRWRGIVIKALGEAEYGDVTLHDIQNCLCELSKYLKVKDGTGRPRAKYKSETVY